MNFPTKDQMLEYVTAKQTRTEYERRNNLLIAVHKEIEMNVSNGFKFFRVICVGSEEVNAIAEHLTKLGYTCKTHDAQLTFDEQSKTFVPAGILAPYNRLYVSVE